MEWPSRIELEAARRTITYKIDDRKVNFSLVKGFEARNYDGSPSGWHPGTFSGERECIEKETIRGRKRTYSNRW